MTDNGSGLRPLITTPYAVEHLITSSGSSQYVWMTPWYLATGVDAVRALVKLQNATSNLQVQMVIQTAKLRTDAPDVPTAIGTTYSTPSTNQEWCTGVVSVTGYNPAHLWFRLGFVYISTNAAFAQADVALQATWCQYGSIINSTAVALEAPDTSARYMPLTGWFPSLYGKMLKVSFNCEGVTGGSNLQFQYVVQFATSSVEQAGAWSALVAGYDSWHAAGVPGNVTEDCTGELTVNDSSHLWMRVGVAYNLTSGTTLVSANLASIISVRT